MKWKSVLVAAVLSSIPNAARGEAPRPNGATGGASGNATSTRKDADTYCRWIESAAASESDTLLFPSLYASAGYTTGADASTTAGAASTLAPTQRLILGASYSFGAAGLNHGIAIRSRAASECRLYEAMTVLRAFIEQHREGASRRALAAKSRVLEEALPHALEILNAQNAKLAQARATLDEVNATSLRVDGLRKLASDTRAQLDSMELLPQMPNEPIRGWLDKRDQAEEEAERGAAHVRQSQGWDLSIRGGYDRIFGVRDYTPVFAMATLTLNLGWLVQGSNDGEAARARRAFARSEVLGVDDRVEQVLRMLRATRDAEAVRLRENRVLVLDMEAHFKDIGAIGGDRAKSYSDALWFDLVRARAERAYLEENVRELTVLLDDGGK
jgi:hypothetical protein